MTIVLSCLELSSLIYNETQAFKKFSLVKLYEEDSFHPKFLIAKNQEDLFIAIKGESSLNDVEMMIDFMPITINTNSEILNQNIKQEDNNLFVTSSVYKSAQNIIQIIQENISNCKGKLIFTGHSFGGSVAAMTALLIRLNRTTENNCHLRTFAITFGSYPCVSPILSQISRKFTKGFVVNHDVFPSMNPKNINNILDSIVQRGTSQAQKGAARVTVLFSKLIQYLANNSQIKEIDINKKSLEMTLKIVKMAPEAAKIKMVNAGVIYHIFDDIDPTLNDKSKKNSNNFFKKLFKVDDNDIIKEQVENQNNIEISQFNEDVEYRTLLELLGGISDHYINSYNRVIKKSQNSKIPYY